MNSAGNVDAVAKLSSRQVVNGNVNRYVGVSPFVKVFTGTQQELSHARLLLGIWSNI